MIEDSHPHFIPDAHSGRRGLTAVLLTGTAKEFGIDQRDIRSTRGGFYITPRMLEALGDEIVLALVPDDEDEDEDVEVEDEDVEVDLGDAEPLDEADAEPYDYDPADYSIDEVKATVSEDPYTDTVDYVIEKEKAGKARKTLLTWLAEFEASERPVGA